MAAADNLPMPYHHATRLELTNVAAFPSLAKHRGVRVRLTIDITSRDIRKVPNRNEWRATYAARIVRACRPAPVGVELAVMAKVLVTGSAGTVGRPLCEELGRRGHVVRALDVAPTPDVADAVVADVADAAAVQAAMRGVDAVVHLAAQPHERAVSGAGRAERRRPLQRHGRRPGAGREARRAGELDDGRVGRAGPGGPGGRG